MTTSDLFWLERVYCLYSCLLVGHAVELLGHHDHEVEVDVLHAALLVLLAASTHPLLPQVPNTSIASKLT